MRRYITSILLWIIGISLLSGLFGCGIKTEYPTAADVVETRQPEEIQQMADDANAKEEALAEAVIYRVRPYQVEAEDMQKWSEALFGGNTAYMPRIIYGNRDQADRIDELKWKETDWNFQNGGYYSWTTDSYGNPEGSYITRCLQLETKLGDELGRLRWSEIGDEQGTLRFDRFEKYTETGAPAWPDENDLTGEEVENRNTISLEEAEKMGYELLANMGLEDYVLIRSVESMGSYNLSFAKTYDGKMIFPENWNSFLSGDNKEKIYYCCEDLVVKILDNEIKLVQWDNPLEIIEEDEFFLTDNMLLQLTEQYREDLKGYILGVPTKEERNDGVDERMFRVQSMMDEDEFWIIPCWKRK